MPTLDWLNRDAAFRTAAAAPTRVLRPHAAGRGWAMSPPRPATCWCRATTWTRWKRCCPSTAAGWSASSSTRRTTPGARSSTTTTTWSIRNGCRWCCPGCSCCGSFCARTAASGWPSTTTRGHCLKVGQVWAARSDGRAVFAMLFKLERGMDLRQQINAALGWAPISGIAAGSSGGGAPAPLVAGGAAPPQGEVSPILAAETAEPRREKGV